MLPLAMKMENPVDDFCIILLYYSQRSLTYQGDALNAMEGIIRRLSSRTKCRFFEGIPTAAIDIFLLFRSHGSSLHRRPEFPSYSWTGWRGPLRIPDQCHYGEINEWLNGSTWIIWHRRSPTGVLNLVWDPAAQDEFPFHGPNYVGYQRRNPFVCSYIRTVATKRTQPTEEIYEQTIASSKTVRPYNLLQFWTLSLFFRVRIVDSIQGEAFVWDSLHDRPCGRLFLDGLEDSQFHEYDGAFEIIVLSAMVDFSAYVGGRISLSGWIEESGLDPNAPAYNVMIIEWMGIVAERRGIGIISQESVAYSSAPGPVWKEIVLG